MEQLEFAAADPHQRIEPLQDGQCRREKQVHGMAVADVRPLVRKDGGIALVVIPPEDDMPQPAERGGFPRHKMEGISVAPFPGRAPEEAEHAAVRTDVKTKRHEHSGQIEQEYDSLPGERDAAGSPGSRRFSALSGSHHHRFQPLRIQGRPVHPEADQRQQQADRASCQQRDAVETEMPVPPHHQQEECVEHRQQQRRFQQVCQESTHFRPFSIWEIRALSSSRSIFSSSTKRDTTLA